MIRTARVALPLLLLAGACHESGESAAADGGARDGDPLAIRPLTVKGSDTMVILSRRMAERFMTVHDMTRVNVTGGGSVLGVNGLLDGSADMADVSRPLQDREKSDIKDRRNKPAVETKIALDGLAVYANRRNAVASLTLAQLRDIYTGKIRNWKEVGGADQAIVLYGRDNQSGTHGYFREHVLQGAAFSTEVKEMLTSPEVVAVANDVGGIGYGGIAYESRIRSIPIKADEKSPAVEPTLATIVNGTYPISRGLYLDTVGEPTGLARNFVDFALSPEGQKIVEEVGYYPLTARSAPPAAAQATP